ncbi:MAG TPA: alkaline phosphatase family protein [Verrucomicrobiales bacterium]|nr:alkaline phosphatase family protein [Verrucomicrobiales bacterium]
MTARTQHGYSDVARVVILDVVALTPRVLERAPRLRSFAAEHGVRRIRPVFPAVTCSAQATWLTGLRPRDHGIVGNGWYDRDLAEPMFWKQSNRLVHGEKLWETMRRERPGYTCAKLFWWYNMYSSANWSATPRPMYPADGRKVFDIYTWPPELHTGLVKELGPFPFPAFWGPAAGIASSEWIAAVARWVEDRHHPDLSLVYLPHLDYEMQRSGPEGPAIGAEIAAIDGLVGGLLDFYCERGVTPVLLSEYGIESVERPVHLNRVFRAQGWLAVREELGRERLDCGASRAFALADHQAAHIYVRDPDLREEVRECCAAVEGVAEVLDEEGKRACGLDHPRSGDLVAVAEAGSWFTYYFWEEAARAPDFARTVDIHRKPGYDPVELFLDPALCCPRLRIGWQLARKKMGFRSLMEVIPLDAGLVRGSHGRIPEDSRDWPVLVGGPAGDGTGDLESWEVRDLLLAAIRGTQHAPSSSGG